MKRRTFLAVGLAAPLLSGCGYHTFSYNYRLKIVVRVGDQLHEGSSVVAVTKIVRPNGICYAQCWNGGVRAEAREAAREMRSVRAVTQVQRRADRDRIGER